MINTRFCPTANGALHYGHLYMALVNKGLADEGGGDFTIRFEDTAASLQHLGKERIRTICKNQIDDLAWAGIIAERYIYQSAIDEEVEAFLLKRGFKRTPQEDPVVVPGIIAEGNMILYPYTPSMTAEKVVMDWMTGTTLLVRGIDLLSEYSLYTHYCRMFELPEPRHLYLPRLKGPFGDISKTNGGCTIAGARSDGISPAELRDMIGRACLKNPPNGWSLDNLKAEPRITL